MTASMSSQNTSPPNSFVRSHHTRYPSFASCRASHRVNSLSSGFAWLSSRVSRPRFSKFSLAHRVYLEHFVPVVVDYLDRDLRGGLSLALWLRRAGIALQLSSRMIMSGFTIKARRAGTTLAIT